MAVSGSGGAYYRSPSTIANTNLIHNANTIHLWVKANAVPSTANVRTACSLVGDGLAGAPPQNPHEQVNWNHTSGTFVKARAHRVAAGTYVAAQLASIPAADTWHSWASTFDGTNARSYLNGALDGTSGATSASFNASVWVDVLAGMTSAGALDSSSQFIGGQVAEVAVWNTALTAEEITSLSKGYRAKLIRRPNLLFYAPLIRDLAEIRNSRTLVKQAGTDTYTDHPPVIG
jgi:hypothetical protein